MGNGDERQRKMIISMQKVEYLNNAERETMEIRSVCRYI